MNVKLLQIVLSRSYVQNGIATDALGNLAKQKTPARLTFTLSRVVKAIDNEMQEFRATVTALYEKYGEQVTDDNSQVTGWKLGDENKPLFDQEYQELLDTEVDLPISQIPLSSIPDSIEIPAEPDGVLLEWLFDVDK